MKEYPDYESTARENHEEPAESEQHRENPQSYLQNEGRPQAPDSTQANVQGRPKYLERPVEPPPWAAEAVTRSQQGGGNYLPVAGVFLGGLFAGAGGQKVLQVKSVRTG